MADKGRSCQFRRWLTAVITAVSLSAIITPVDAQQGRTGEPSRTTRAGQATTPSTSPSSTRPGDPARAERDTDPDRQGEPEPTPGVPGDPETATDTAGTTADTAEAGAGTPRRTKPERPYYFTAHYAQRFDDNVLLLPNDRSSDLVSVPLAGFGVTRVRRRSLMKVDYLGGAEIYSRRSELSGMVQSFDLRLEYDLSKRTTFFATDRFLTRPQTTGLGLFGTGSRAGAIDQLSASRSTLNDLFLGLTHQLSKHSNLHTSYGYFAARYNDPRLVDTNEQSLEFGYSRRVSRTREYDLIYRVSRFTGLGSLTTHTLLPTIRYVGRRGLTLRAGAGPQLAVVRTGNVVNVAAVADLSYTTRNTTYSVAYTTGVGTSGGLATASRNQTVFGAVEHVFSPRLQTEFRVGYSRSNNVGNTSGPLMILDFSSSSLIFESRTAMPIGNKLALFVDYVHTRETGSGGSVGKVNRNIFSLGINFDTRRTERKTMLRPVRY